MSGCTPHIDWGVCDESTGFSRVLPAYFVSSAVVHGTIGVLYLVSVAQTLRGQLREKRKYSYNTAIQMHVGIMASSFLALCYDAVSATWYTQVSKYDAFSFVGLNALGAGFRLSPRCS